MTLNRNWLIWIRHSFSFTFNCFLASSLFSNLVYGETWKDNRRTDQNPTNYNNRRKFLPGQQCQHTHMILQPPEFLRSLRILFISDDFSSPPPDQTNERYFQVFSVTKVAHSVFLYCPGLRAELHHDLCENTP